MDKSKSLWPPFGGPFLFLAFYLSNFGLEPKQQTFLAIFAFVVYNWLIAWLPLFVTGLVGVALTILFGIEDAVKAMAPLAHPIIFIFLTGFLFAKAMSQTGLDERISLFILGRKFVAKSFDRLLFSVLALTGLFSMWVSNTATTAMMLPIMLGITKSLGIEDPKAQTYLLLGLAYSSSVGGIGSPVGSPPNIIAMGMLEELAGIEIGFFEWTLFGAPLGFLFLLVIFCLVKSKVPKQLKKIDPSFIRAKAGKLKPLSSGEIWLMLLFAALLSSWFFPGLLSGLFGKAHPQLTLLDKRMNPGAVGLIISSALFVFPLGKKPKLLSPKDVRDIDWASLLLFGSGLALGKILFDTGLAKIAGDFLVSGIADSNYLILIAALCYFTIFSTELASNTATANILIPIVIASSGALGVAPQGPAIAVALSCSLAFMLPVATPPNAIVYGSGKVDIPTMIKFGFLLNILFGCLLVIIFYFLKYLL